MITGRDIWEMCALREMLRALAPDVYRRIAYADFDEATAVLEETYGVVLMGADLRASIRTLRKSILDRKEPAQPFCR